MTFENLRPGMDITGQLRSSSFTIRWSWREDTDDEAFLLECIKKDLRHGLAGYPEKLLDKLPMEDSYEEIERPLKAKLSILKEKGWSISVRPFSTSNNTSF